MWDIVAVTLQNLLTVNGIDHDLLTPTKVRNPYTIDASCRCISFGGRWCCNTTPDELLLQQELAAMENCLWVAESLKPLYNTES